MVSTPDETITTAKWIVNEDGHHWQKSGVLKGKSAKALLKGASKSNPSYLILTEDSNKSTIVACSAGKTGRLSSTEKLLFSNIISYLCYGEVAYGVIVAAETGLAPAPPV